MLPATFGLISCHSHHVNYCYNYRQVRSQIKGTHLFGQEIMKLTVEMYGLAPYTELNSIDIEVKENAGLKDLFGAIIKQLPYLEGHVIQSGVNQLIETYGIYINGRFIIQDEQIEVKPGDKIVLIL